jgi:hypothetical protein
MEVVVVVGGTAVVVDVEEELVEVVEAGVVVVVVGGDVGLGVGDGFPFDPPRASSKESCADRTFLPSGLKQPAERDAIKSIPQVI